MMTIPEIKFGNFIYNEYEGNNAYVTNIGNVEQADFLSYCAELTDYTFLENHDLGQNSFRTYVKGNDAVYLAYYPNVKEMRIVTEENSAYLKYFDESGIKCTTPQVTQVDLEDFGMSYVVRLEDGRFIIFDGGWYFEPDADSLMRILNEQKVGDRPRIAAWIMTHPHLDHYRCFFPFYEKYIDNVDIEKFIYNFPDVNNTERMPALLYQEEVENLNKFYGYVSEIGAPVYKAHTGQVYNIGNARMEVVSSVDDSFFAPVRGTNPCSTVTMMYIAGQKILWCGDTDFEPNKFGQRWGHHLKCDILQVPHHGFNGGAIYEYNFIDPTVCLCPCFERETFETMNIYKDYNRHLMFNMNVEEYLSGGCGDIILPLPYTPKSNGKKILFDRAYEVQKGLGAKSWFFSDLTPETAEFTLVNPTAYAQDVYIDLFFEESTNYVDSIKLTIPGRTVKKYNITDTKDVDPDALFFNRRALAKVGIPEGKVFTAHFRSKYPIIIKGANKPEYCW